jgi:hypothetical protein
MTPYKGKLAIFTSFYSYHAYSPYVISLAQTLGVLSKLGIEWDYLARPADFHIERALNNTLSDLMKRDDFTDVFLIDSDESWKPEHFVRLLLHPEEIVAGTYRMKNNDSEYVGSLKYEDGSPVGKKLPDGSYLLEATRVAAGFLRIKVSALRKWAAAYPDAVSVEPDGVHTQFFRRELMDEGDGKMVMGCQDMVFSKKWLDIGGRLWIDPMVHVNHWWMTRHEGNFDGYLKARKRLSDASDAISVVQEMAQRIRDAKSPGA